MTLTEEEIQQILNLGYEGKSIGYTTRKTKFSRNTVRKYLQNYGISCYMYSPNLHTGSPSSFQRSSFSADSKDQKIQQLTNELIVIKNENSSLKGERDELKHNNMKQEETIESQQQMISELEHQCSDQKHHIKEITEKHQNELEEQEIRVKKAEQEMKTKEMEHQKTLHRLNTGVDQLIDKFNHLEKRNKTLSDENALLKRNQRILEDKLKDAPMKYGALGAGIGGVIGAAAGAIGYHMFTTRPSVPQGKWTMPAQRINPIQDPVPFMRPLSVSGIPVLKAYTSDGDITGTPLHCSGFFPSTSQSNADSVGSSAPVIVQPPPYDETTKGLPLAGDQSMVSWSGLSETSGFTPQITSPVYIPNQTSYHYYHYLSLPDPLPEDLSEVYIMKQIMALDGISFENFIEDLLIYRGCPTERTPKSGDKSADIITTLNGERTIFECKQKSSVGIDTVQRVFAAKKHYNADQAIIVTPGTFTKDAIDEATRVLHIQLWDGKRLLEELYKSQFFRLPK